MGMADSDRGGSGSGGAGVGGGGGSTGGRDRGTGFDGRDTPGAPDAADGRRGSSMGPDGGRATGGGNSNSNGWSKDTPGAPNTPGRRGASPGSGRDGRGTNTPGSPAARARDAMSRHARNRDRERTTEQEGLVNFGIGKDYSHADAIAERAQTGAVSPREADIARGYNSGRNKALAEQSVGGVAGTTVARGTSIPGVNRAVKSGVGALAGDTAANPETTYGAAVARSRASNTMAQSAAQVGATIAAGPAAGMAVGMANTAINANRTRDIGRMADAMGFDNGNPNTIAGSGNGNGTTAGMLTEARATLNQPVQTPDFAWNPVNIDNYGKGLLSLARTS